jgi:hypothetical protein
MANGLLGSTNLSTTNGTVIYTAPSDAGTAVTCKIFIANRNGSAVSIRIGLGNSGDTDVTTSNAIEWDVPVPAFGVIERGNIILGQSQRVIARTSAANVSVVVCGVEGF